jgi:hypothetical protein
MSPGNNGAVLRDRVAFGDAAAVLPAAAAPIPSITRSSTGAWGLATASAPPRAAMLGLRATASYELPRESCCRARSTRPADDNLDKVFVIDKGGSLPPVRSDVRNYNEDSRWRSNG